MKFYVTYGFGYNLRDCYSEIEAESKDAARKIAFDITKSKFAFIYPESEFDSAIKRHGLHLVPLQPQITVEV